jgi:hypothetical protein
MTLGRPTRYVIRAIAFLSFSVSAGQGIHIDGSSDASADRSFQRMMNSLDTNQKQQLAIAMIQLNMVGVESAREAINDPGLQHPSAGRIKDKIAGLTASEIIDLAHRTATTTRVYVEGSEPGVPRELLRPLAEGAPTQPLSDTTWAITEDINGHVTHMSYALHADHTATLVEKDTKPGGTSRWEQSGNEIRLSVNDGYAVLLGSFSGSGSAAGEGANKTGGHWSWTAVKK